MKIYRSKLLWVTSVLLLITSSLAAQKVDFLANNSEAFQELKLTSIAFFDAVKSRDSLGMMLSLAEEFTLTSSESNGELMGRTQYVNGSLRPDILTVISFRQHDFKIRKYRTMAIVQSRIDWKSEYKGMPWNADFLITDIFVFRDRRWQIVHRHSSYPANKLKEVVKMREGQ
ncbi:MAG: nuclear transport factor 2 family protein [Reichenbachiella sp.]|uniref:nuclear transport factor 2 family protein n=1 Tax=Reichenbachiella sp. TaxID=2184521 RepID=UPI0032988CF3